MSGNAQANLARQYGLMSALVFTEDYTKSPFFYRGYSTYPNHWRETKTITPDVKEVTYGATSEFKIPIAFDKLGSIVLAWDQGPLTTTGGTFRRFCDWFALALIEKIEFIFDNTVVFVHFPEKKYLRTQKFVSTEERDNQAACLFGNLSTTQRNALSPTTQEVIFEVPFQWTLAPDRYIAMRALSDTPTIRITWRRLEQVVQTDGTAPVSVVNNLRLIANAWHVEAGERNTHVLLTERDHGLVSLMEESIVNPRHATSIIPAAHFGGGGGAPLSTWAVELKNLKTDIRTLTFMIRKKANMDPPNLAKNLYYESSELTNGGVPWVKRFRILSGSNEEITPWVTAKFNTLIEHNNNFYGPALPGIYFITFALHPMDELNASGSFNMNNVQDPKLELELNNFAVAAEDLEVTVIQSRYNTVQHVRGSISRQFLF